MNTVSASTVATVVTLIVAAALVVVWLIHLQQLHHSRRLRRRFGAEYDRTVQTLGRRRGEAELKQREERVARLRIVPLPAADAARFHQAWRELQGRFIDNPRGVVAEADFLVRDLMTKRGYPMTEFEHLAADLSVDHANVVSTYRAAQAIAARDTRGEADTEELRKAVVHYRALFDELLEINPVRTADPSRQHIAAHT